jgi:(S)-mandelate dehydrogenase
MKTWEKREIGISKTLGEANMSALDDCYNIFDMREAAKRRLPRGIFEFVDRATEDHLAVTDNRSGFQDIKLRHRALVDVSGRSTKTMLFGFPSPCPPPR